MQAYLNGVAQEAGRIDIFLNVMGPQAKDYGQGTSTQELPLEQFLVPLSTMLPSQFITARAAARHMIQQRSGAILFVMSHARRGSRQRKSRPGLNRQRCWAPPEGGRLSTAGCLSHLGWGSNHHRGDCEHFKRQNHRLICPKTRFVTQMTRTVLS